MSKFHEQLTYFLRERQLERSTLVEHLIISASTLAKWENGVSFPDQQLAKKLAHLLGVEYEVLVGDDYNNIQKTKTNNRLYNLDAHYSAFSSKTLLLLNSARTIITCFLLITLTVTIQTIPKDSLLYAIILPYSIALLFVIVYGYLSFHERKFYKIRSLHFIRSTRVVRTSVLIRSASMLIILGFVFYIALSSFSNYENHTLMNLSISITLLSLSSMLISWIFYQSIAVVTIDAFEYNALHDETKIYQYEVILKDDTKGTLVIDQITPRYVRVIYNGIEYFQMGKGTFKVINNTTIESKNNTAFLIGEDLFPILIKTSPFFSPKIKMDQAKVVHNKPYKAKFNIPALMRLLYCLSVLTIILLLL